MDTLAKVDKTFAIKGKPLEPVKITDCGVVKV